MKHGASVDREYVGIYHDAGIESEDGRQSRALLLYFHTRLRDTVAAVPSLLLRNLHVEVRAHLR